MATERELNILIKAKDMASNVLNKYGEQFTQIGGALTAVGVAGAAGFGMAIKTAADFESQMSKVSAISGATDEEMAALTETAKSLGATTTKSASEVATGMQEMAAMGFTANEVIGAMPGVIAAAEASGSDMAQTSEVMAAALNIFNLEAGEAGRVADILAKTANISAASLTDMQYALKYAGPPAAALGVSLEETSAAIGLMTNAGMKGEQAGTTLRSALLGLLDPSEENSRMMEAMGIQITDTSGNFVGIAQLIENLSGSMEGMTETQKAANLASLVGKEAVSGMLTLMKEGPETIRTMTGELENSAGSSKKAADIMTDNLNGALELMKGSFESLQITVGEQFTPILKEAAKFIGGVVDKFGQLDPQTQKTITMVALATTGFGLLAGGLLLVIPLLPVISGAIAALLGPVGLVIAIIAALAVAVFKNFDEIKAFITSHSSEIKTVLETGWNIIKGVIKTAGDAIKAVMDVVFPHIQRLIKAVMNDVIPFLIEMWNKFSVFFNEVMPPILQLVKTIWEHGIGPVIKAVMKNIGDIIKVVWDSIKLIFSGALNIIMGAIKLFVSLFTGDWRGMWEAIKQILTGAWDLIKGIFKGVFGTLGSIIKNGLQTVLGIFSAAVSTWWNIGKDMIMGLANGISENIAKVIKAVTDTVEGAVDAAKKFLHIKSPSRLMMEIGAYTGEGFAIGIKDQASDVMQAAKDMAAMTVSPFERNQISAPSFAGSAGSATGSAAAAPQIILHFGEGSVVLPGVTNGKQLVEQLSGFAMRQAFKST